MTRKLPFFARPLISSSPHHGTHEESARASALLQLLDVTYKYIGGKLGDAERVNAFVVKHYHADHGTLDEDALRSSLKPKALVHLQADLFRVSTISNSNAGDGNALVQDDISKPSGIHSSLHSRLRPCSPSAPLASSQPHSRSWLSPTDLLI